MNFSMLEKLFMHSWDFKKVKYHKILWIWCHLKMYFQISAYSLIRDKLLLWIYKDSSFANPCVLNQIRSWTKAWNGLVEISGGYVWCWYNALGSRINVFYFDPWAHAGRLSVLFCVLKPLIWNSLENWQSQSVSKIAPIVTSYSISFTVKDPT